MVPYNKEEDESLGEIKPMVKDINLKIRILEHSADCRLNSVNYESMPKYSIYRDLQDIRLQGDLSPISKQLQG